MLDQQAGKNGAGKKLRSNSHQLRQEMKLVQPAGLIAAAEFCSRQLMRLKNMRDSNTSILTAFMLALESAFPETGPANVGTEKKTAEKRRGEAATRSFSTSCLSYYRNVRALVQLARSSQNLQLIAVDPPRLDLNGEEPLRDLILAHTDSNHPALTTWHNHCFDPAMDVLLVFDPLMSIRGPRLVDGSEAIITNPFSFMLLGLIKIQPAFLSVYRMFSDWGGGGISAIAQRVSMTLFVAGVYSIVRDRTALMLSLTANSVFLEALRAIFLESGSRKVVEIQHGVPNPISDPFFIGYRDEIRQTDRGFFELIPLLGPPFCLPSEESAGFAMHQRPSNSAVFRMFKQMAPDVNHINSTMAHRVDIITDNIFRTAAPILENGRPLFSVFGGTDESSDFYAGPMLSVEMCLVDQLREAFNLKGIDPLFVYHPHPANRPITSIATASGIELPIFQNSQIAYFCADMAFALYSAAIFEAASLGVHTFAPLVDDYPLFDRFLTDGISHPKTLAKDAILDAIDAFAQSYDRQIEVQRDDIAERVSKFLAVSIANGSKN